MTETTMRTRGACAYGAHHDDWCHICGYRVQCLVDVFYPKNAEHGGQREKYLRICAGCLFTFLQELDCG